jgi:trehalose 6-phosphate phosphatase
MTEASPGSPAAQTAVHPWTAVRARALALLDAGPPLLVIADFDGTLAPITLDPLATRIDPLARAALRRLARTSDRHPDRLAVAVLSGRTALDVAGRVRVGGLRYLGNHGLEGGAVARRARVAGLRVEVPADLAPFVPVAEVVAARVGALLGAPPWLFVERKGPSVAFHFRQAPDPDAAREAVLRAVATAGSERGSVGLATFEGRMVVELRPLGAGGKGAATERLLGTVRPRAVIALGDDRTDAEAFAVLRREREAGRLDALAVGVHAGHEMPREVIDTADVLLASTHEAARVLAALARAVERAGDGG